MTTIAPEKIKFDAEIGKVLHLMIHSLYTNKDIFLRELISNASDACDKLRYLAQTTPDLLKDHPGFKISITVNQDARTVTIRDTGIGMNRDELIENLGTIARSGTQKFLEQMTGDQAKDAQLIGQFGVGFYSSFMVADKVTVYSRKAGDTTSWIWTSAGDGEFEIARSETADATIGTAITLHLKTDEDEFLDIFRIRHIVKTYSDHIAVPVELLKAGEEDKAEIVNSSSALWTRSKSEITEEEYQQFYKNIAFAGDNPWLTLHNKNEGVVEFTNLLYIPTSKPFDLYHPDRRCRVKLYVKRVYINDEGINIVPAYLRFLRGVVDSQDLPLNISRETLQHNRVVEKIRQSIIKRVLSELKKKATDDIDGFTNFWNNFGPVVKEGLCEANEHRDALLEVCRFRSSTQGDQLVSLADYIGRMKEGQTQIFYLTGDNIDKMKASPQLEGFYKNNIEVLLFADPVDDFWVNVVHEYQEKELCSITRSDINLETLQPQQQAEETKKDETSEIDDQAVLEAIKTNLTGLVKDVKSSKKLVDSPACLAVAEGSMDMRMERFLIEQKQLASTSLKILEVNLEHPIVQVIAKEVKAGQSDIIKDLSLMLLDQACILEGEPLPDLGAFAKRWNQYLLRGLN